MIEDNLSEIVDRTLAIGFDSETDGLVREVLNRLSWFGDAAQSVPQVVPPKHLSRLVW